MAGERRPAFHERRDAPEKAGSIGTEWMFAGAELPCQDAEREDIGAGVGRAAAQLLG